MAKDPADRWSMERVRDVLAAGPTRHRRRLSRWVCLPAWAGAADDDRTRTMQTDPDPDPDHEPTDPALYAAPPDIQDPAPEPQRRDRRGLLAILAVVVVLALIVLIGWALLRGDPEQPAADQRGSGSETPSESPKPTKKKTEGPTAQGMTTFVEDYLATVTTSPAESWKMLTPEFQAASGGFGAYQQFWNGFESASPSAIKADPKAMTVSYSVAYEKKDGSTPTDNVTLELVQQDGKYLIAGEQ